MKSVAVFFILLILSLIIYLGYSERFPYLNGIVYQKAGMDQKAAEMFEKGCELGNLPSCYDLGEQYENGQGVTKDLQKAQELYEKASKRGYLPASESLERLSKTSALP